MVRNSGSITSESCDIDLSTFTEYMRGKTALVTQGGGQRGVFTAGVLDSFLLSQFDPFSEYFGTSAGALNLCAFLCRKPYVGRGFITDITTSQEFFSLFRYIRSKQHLEVAWALEKVQQEPWRLNVERGYLSLGEKKAFAAVTNRDTLSDEYLPIFTEDWLQTLVATCAIPKLAKSSVTINGQEYFDGGISASIPVQEAWRRNNRNIIVVRTEPLENSSESALSNGLTSQNSGESSLKVHEALQQKWALWKDDWNQYVQQKLDSKQKSVIGEQSVLNGGRWLFGADNLYRLSHLIGEHFDSGLADMLMIHYQTYELTLDFLQNPPDDTFILQIAPENELQSSSLLSSKEALEHDYLEGFKAGEKAINLYKSAEPNLQLKLG